MNTCPICEETVYVEPDICQVIADDMRVERRMVAEYRDQSDDVFIADEMATDTIVVFDETDNIIEEYEMKVTDN